MNIDIRKSIIANFKNSKTEEIKESIIYSIQAQNEITLPGLGVFFEQLWNHSEDNGKEYILNTLQNSFNI